jgi:hypothetical protein
MPGREDAPSGFAAHAVVFTDDGERPRERYSQAIRPDQGGATRGSSCFGESLILKAATGP